MGTIQEKYRQDMNFQTVETAYVHELYGKGPAGVIWRLTGILDDLTIFYGEQFDGRGSSQELDLLRAVNKAVRDLYDNFIGSQVGASNG